MSGSFPASYLKTAVARPGHQPSLTKGGLLAPHLAC